VRKTARQAAVDLYYNSTSLIPANVVFGLALIAMTASVAISPWGWIVMIILVPLAAGCMAQATSVVRDGHTDLGTFVAILRKPWEPLTLGAIQIGLGAVLVVDLLVGVGIGGFVGSVLAISAVYGLVILWIYAVVAWPLVLDPRRRGETLGTRLRLAGTLLVARPIRMAFLALTIGLFIAISTVAVAAIVMFALALAFLFVARMVLPAADRLEGRPIDPDPV
jgi:hypothetical protein